MEALKKRFPSLSSLGSDGNTSFLRAARAGNLDKVLEHLKNNIDINTCNANGLNALHLASKDGHVHVVSELLKRGAIVDSATKKGNTALHIASLAGQEDVVKLLLQHGASVNVQSQNGFTPLYMAAQENHDSVVKLLLANGANQSLATEDGFTPLAVAMQQGHDRVVAVLLESDTRGKVRLPALHIAAKKDDVKAATLLLENDHNPDVTSKSGFTPLHIASHYGNEAIANLLIQKGADVNYAAKHNISPLHVAAKWGKTNMVSLLLEKGANIEAKTRDGLTPLHCAARSGHEQVVDMLLERGAPISAKTKNGLAPLHMAAQGEHVDAARILLYHRAPVDEVTVDYLTALHVAAHCGHVRVAKLLLDRNADANARALNGFTPLHIACKKNRIKVVELLLRHGASISATTESGLTPLHVASFMGCMNIVIYLLQHDASPDVPTVRGETPLHLAARANQTDIIRILLRNGAQVDARAREQQTPLHIASRLGNVDIVMLLLQHGAQVDATTKDMYTALHIAAKEGQDEVAAVLIENGASLDATTKKGFTPLHLTAKYGHMKVAQLLLQKDAPVDAQGKNGVTPLHVASHYDNQNVALLLLEKGASPHATAKNGHTPLHIAARKNQMDIATTLLEYGAQSDAESKAGFTPLHLSSQEGHADMSALLLEHKAGCDHQARNGLTPLHLCAQEDKVNVAQILVKNGANIEITTKAGYTPLHVASHFGQSNMVRFLLQNGANVDAATGIGYTPLHQAAQQGHCHIVNLLLEHKANANAQTANGQTPLHIARKLGYISVLDSLKSITNESTTPTQTSQPEEKYRVVAPEAMHETFMSDSEEEGGEDTVLSDQPYRYLTVDEMKSLGDDSLPIDVTRDERQDSNRMTQSSENPIQEDHIIPQHAQIHMTSKTVPDGKYIADNIMLDRQHPQHVGFLVSFLVDARGGAMRGCRHSGVRIIVPARSASQPTRITCRYVKPQRTMHPPQLMEGEALASRVLELGPISTKFLGPVIMEVPHFASLRGKEREIVILRSDNGETWREHTIDNSEEIIHDILNECFEPEDINQLDELGGGRVCRFVTYDFPQYFAVVSRIRQEVHAIGPEGGMVSSTVVPQVQAVFPQGALTKKIKVGLQAQPIDPDLTAKLLGRGVAVSPIVTVEPRRRKFHKAITLSMPAPKAHSQGMINQYSGNAPTLRLLCSITGGPSRAQWEDVTGSTPLTFVNDCVSFTTTVSARFWLMDCRNISEATKMATELYREAIHVPFMAKFVVFAKRVEPNEARLRVFCMTDDKEDKTLEQQEHFTEVAKSRDVEVLEGKSQYIEMAGNLVPVTKSGDQLQLTFKAFRENRLPFNVRVKDQHADTVGRTLFMREPKVAKGEPPQQPICILNIVLPEKIIPDQVTSPSESKEILSRLDMSYTITKPFDDYNYLGDMRIVDISNLLGEDWIRLAPEIGINQTEISNIQAQNQNSTPRQAQAMIRLFKQKKTDRNILENGLRTIGRNDIIQKCIKITSYIESSKQERATKRISVDNAFDETDIMKDSESVEELVLQEDQRLQQMREREEVKYSAEEKIVEDSESDDENHKRSVAERRQKIEKRLSLERAIPASEQKKEIVQELTEIKRKSLIEDKKAIHEEEIMLQMPTDNIIKSATVPEQIIKLKTNKIETPDISKSEFDKELQDKFKKTVKVQDNREEIIQETKTITETIISENIEPKQKELPTVEKSIESIKSDIKDSIKLKETEETVKSVTIAESTSKTVAGVSFKTPSPTIDEQKKETKFQIPQKSVSISSDISADKDEMIEILTETVSDILDKSQQIVSDTFISKKEQKSETKSETNGTTTTIKKVKIETKELIDPDLEKKLSVRKEKIEKFTTDDGKITEQQQQETVVTTAQQKSTDKIKVEFKDDHHRITTSTDDIVPKSYHEKHRESLTEEEFYKSVEASITKKMSEGLIQIDDNIITSVSKDIPESQTPPPTPIEIQSQKDGIKYESPESIPEEITDAKKDDHFDIKSTTSTTITSTTIKKGDLELIRNEAMALIDSVLEESILIINAQQLQCNNYNVDDNYHSESEQYAITCDVTGIDMVKSPTIESFDGKSFDDNMSVNDELNNYVVPYYNNNINNTTTITSTASHYTIIPPSITSITTTDSTTTNVSTSIIATDTSNTSTTTTTTTITTFPTTNTTTITTTSTDNNLIDLTENISTISTSELKQDTEISKYDTRIHDNSTINNYNLNNENLFIETTSNINNYNDDDDDDDNNKIYKSDDSIDNNISENHKFTNYYYDDDDNKRSKYTKNDNHFDRIEKKFERLSSQYDDNDIDENVEKFDINIDTFISKDEISNLQSDFSKISWDESFSCATTTAADVGLSTPDNDLQDLPTEPGSQTASTEIENVPKPTPRLSITSISSDLGHKTNEIISAQTKILKETTTATTTVPTAAEAKTISTTTSVTATKIDNKIDEDVDFEHSKKFWESLESSSQSESQQQISSSSVTPIPKPRSQIKPTIMTSIDSIQEKTDTDSIGSAKSSSQSKISSEQQVEYSETSSIRTSLKEDDSELSDAKIELEEDVSISQQKVKDDEKLLKNDQKEKKEKVEDTDKKESVDNGSAQVGFYIGESSQNIITKSSTERRQEFAFDNEGYEGTFDEDRDIEELEYDDDQKKTVQKSEICTDESAVKKLQEEIEKDSTSTTVIPTDSTRTIKEYEIVELEDLERRKSETKVIRQPSETRNDILECEYETAKSSEMDTTSSPIKLHTAKEVKIEDPTEKEELLVQNIYYEDQTQPIPQEALKEEIPKYVSEVIESQIYKTETEILKDETFIESKQTYSAQEIENKITYDHKTTESESKSKSTLDKKSTSTIETETGKTVKGDQIKEEFMKSSFDTKTELVEKDEFRIEKDQKRETTLKKDELIKEEMHSIKSESIDKGETKIKLEPKLELNLEKSELELSEKRFSKTISKEEHTSSDKTILSPIRSQKTTDDFKKSLLIDPSQVDQTMVEQTLAEVKESLDAVQEELIEVVKDGKLIKESPSEFEFKVLPQVRYMSSDTIQESFQEEVIGTAQESKPADKQEQSESSEEKVETIDASKADDYPSISSTEDSSNKLDVAHRVKKEAILDSAKRWSVPEPDQFSSGDSHYQSFEKTDSRPLSSDVENLLTYGASSEYQTAQDASLIPESTEYISAVSTLDHSGKTISSHESMKSLDSESSANLGSIEVSETSETLIPSSADADLVGELQEEEFDSDENEMKLSSLDDKFCGVLMEEPITSQMKRSQEMTFKQESTGGQAQLTESPDVTEDKDDFEIGRKFSTSMEESRMCEESRFATSLEEGSVLSMSLSSTSNVDTVVENVEDVAGSFGASSLTGADIQALIRDDYTGTSFDEPSKSEKIDSMIMTSSVGKDEDIPYANTQITTITVTSTEVTDVEPKRTKGHKRTESTAFSAGDFLKEMEGSKSKPTSGYESPLEEENVEIKSKGREEKKESESESDYDAYESEYSRAYKTPTTQQKKSKSKHTETFEKEQEPEKRPFTPSQLVSEIIVEDLTEEIESLKIEEERRPSQNMQDYSNIPDITITEDLQKHMEEIEEDFEEKVLYKVKTQEELHKTEDAPIHYGQEEEFSMPEDRYQDLIQGQYDTGIADITKKYGTEQEEEKADSPDSFEMLEQPDISDEFVIIEEVAKEASEFDTEGKSIKIQSVKYEKKHDEEVEKILVRSAPADPNQGSSMYMRDDINFDFEESPPIASDQECVEGSDAAAANKKWVEMQLSENAAHLRYPYELERGVLEDIKEEDTEFEVGSSRISSFKDSFSSSTPEYDVLAGRKYFTRGEHDDVSMSSLQEFESLEQAISLENRKAHQGSQDSLSNGSFTKRYMARYGGSGGGGQGDDVSLSSLKEFEGLESACIEAQLIEIKAKEEAALLLSRSDESNKSSNGDDKSTTKSTASSSTTVITTIKTTTTQPTTTSETKTAIMTQREIEALIRAKLEECEEESSNLMEVSTDSLELGLKKSKSTNDSEIKGSVHGSCDSLEINKSGDAMTSSIDSFEISKDATARSSRSDVDSLEQQILQDVRRDSVDSIELEQLEQALQMTKTELDVPSGGVKDPKITTTTTTLVTQMQGPSGENIISRTITTTSSTITSGTIQQQQQQQQQQREQMIKDISNDSLNLQQTDPEQLLTSTESLDLHTSSTATNATYQNENDSLMSSSMTSCGSSTMIETLDSNFADIFHHSISSSRTSPFMTHDEISKMTQQQQQQMYTSSITTTTTTAHAQIKDDDKYSFKYSETFDKDSDTKTDTFKSKKGEEVPTEPKPDDKKK